METKFSKGYYGYEAVTEISLPGVNTFAGGPAGGAVLRLSTMKRSGGSLATVASVVFKTPDGGFSFVMFSDFSKTVRIARKVRCTEKIVREFHEAALADVAVIEADARAFYAAKVAA